MYLYIFWSISWVTAGTHIVKEEAFSPLILLCCNLEVSLCFWCFVSALLWGFPSKFSYSRLGQMGTSATANVFIHFTEIWKKLKWLCAVPALQMLLSLLLFCRNTSVSSNKTKAHKCAEGLWIFTISRSRLMGFHTGLDFWAWRLPYIQYQCLWQALF